jgi:hypothetical protein
MKDFTIQTYRGECIIDKIWISDLDHLMIKVFYPKEKVWVNYNLRNEASEFLQGLLNNRKEFYEKLLKEKEDELHKTQ